MSETKYVEDGKDFDKKIAFKVVPVWVFRAEKFCYAPLIRIAKQVDKVLVRIFKKQVVFLYAIVVETPRVYHLRMVTVIDSNPSVKNASHYFQKKNDHKLGIA